MRLNDSGVRGLIISAGVFLFGVGSTIVVERLNLDIGLSKAFFLQGGSNAGWVYGREAPWGQLYDYGEVAGIAFPVAALVVLFLSRWRPTLKRYSKPCLVVILTVIIGPGIIVNALLKNYWGRPRPVEIVEFGGSRQYRPVQAPTTAEVGKSFPCGHCSMAFSVSSLVAFFPWYPTASICALAVGLLYGGLMGVARVAQGGHFLTDVIWAGVIVIMVVALLYYVVLKIPRESSREAEEFSAAKQSR